MGGRVEYLRSHSHVVRDDGLFFELELLEDVGLENLLELCGGWRLAISLFPLH
jgi:hypothetical protein